MRFTEFNFNRSIKAGIDACNYTIPTPIQQKAIPPILDGRDLLGLAQTGTGKTAAFVLPILQHLHNRPWGHPRALIMAPTRELAEQIHENIKNMAAHTSVTSATVYGGVAKARQVDAIQKGVDIIVACPGRLLDLVNDNAIRLQDIEILVLDEADQMLDMGFVPDIRRIIGKLPKNRQTLVFSATMPLEIHHLTQTILKKPKTVRINHSVPAPAISHTLFNVEKQERTALLKRLLMGGGMNRTLVFTRTKHKAKRLAGQLTKAGFNAASLQGNLSQGQRKKALDGFRQGGYTVLVATDIAARGIDVLGISHVVNYDLPDTVETYIHRTGRTGRADETGHAFTFACSEDGKMMVRIEKTLGKKMVQKDPAKRIPGKQAGGPAPRKPVSAGKRKTRFTWSEFLAPA